MAKHKKLVAFLLDQTGSMGSIQDVTISAFNEYVGSGRHKPVFPHRAKARVDERTGQAIVA